jgi:beta-galactosidase
MTFCGGALSTQMHTLRRVTIDIALAGLAIAISPLIARPEPLTVTVALSPPPLPTTFHFGESRRPDGTLLTIDSNSLRLDGKSWTPIMGEFHFSRYPESEWREELLKMKAGGVDIVATYVFWIHHEEIEGQFDWSGCRDLHHFIELCREVGLYVLVRCGPWDHGEVRGGGFPDWLVKKGWRLRADDANYLAKVKQLYGQIGWQCSGLLWKDGGPVIGIQLENEYDGPGEHLLTLKQLARNSGLDVPLYTRTGWPSLRSPLPVGEIIPLYGVYAEGFWDRELTSMPDDYWRGFHFSRLRTDAAIGADLLGRREAKDDSDVNDYPYLTCEIGGGMTSSYHRRILLYPQDVESSTLVKLGSGGTSLGYYMFHGGENPDGKLTTLEETQASGGWNDLPVKNYDFQAPLGQYGQIRPQYHELRRIHSFLQQWGAQLAEMPTTVPDKRPSGKDDFDTLRWCIRSDGKSGFVFVNNYQRLHEMSAKQDVQFAISLPSGPLIFPQRPVTIPPNACFIWPFDLKLGEGVRLIWATAQPLAVIENGKERTVFFVETKGVDAQFAFSPTTDVSATSGRIIRDGDQTVVRDVVPGVDVAMRVRSTNGISVQIVLLNDADSLTFWQANWQGRERAFLTRAGLVVDGDELRLRSTNSRDLNLAVYPAPTIVTFDRKKLAREIDGVFQRFTPPAPKVVDSKPRLEVIQQAGPPRKVLLGEASPPVAAAPGDTDFLTAASWRVQLPPDLELDGDPILRMHYVGDVARVTLNGKLLADDFYNGNDFEIGVRRYAPDILAGDLRIAILPLSKSAPIYMDEKARPDFGDGESAVSLVRVEIVTHFQIQLQAQ